MTPPNLSFPKDNVRRPYNSVALPCYTVKESAELNKSSSSSNFVRSSICVALFHGTRGTFAFLLLLTTKPIEIYQVKTKQTTDLDVLFAKYLNSYDAASVRSYLRERPAPRVYRVCNGFIDRQKTQPPCSSFLCTPS